jgi:outer membrane protein assembly factor BamA
VLQEERSSVGGGISYSRTRTRRFFGIGPDTSDDQESRYTDSEFEVELGSDVAYPDPGDDLVLTGGLRLELHELSGGLGNDPDTKTLYKGLFDEAKHQDLFWITSGLRWDTRDSQRNPYRGWHVGALSDAAPVQSGSDVGGRVTVDASKVFPLPGLFHRGGDPDEENPATDTLFFGLRTIFSWGDLPFFSRPQLGGPDSLRGFVSGRFTDNASWLGRAEYRFWVLSRGFALTRSIRFERVGLALFYEAGSVASGGLQLLDADVKHSFGVSILAGIERALPFRADLGFSDEAFPSPRITAGLGLSF